MNDHLWKSNERDGPGELDYICVKCLDRAHRPAPTPCKGKPLPPQVVHPGRPVGTPPVDQDERSKFMIDALTRLATDQDIESRPACAAIALATLTRLGIKIPDRKAVLAAMARNHAAREKARRERGGEDDA